MCVKAQGEEGYLEKVRNKFKSLIIYTPDLSKPLISTGVEVNIAPDGLIVGSKITSPSGDQTWDYAVIKAIDGAGYIPNDSNGLIPQQAISLTFQPFEKSDQDTFLRLTKERAAQRAAQEKAMLAIQNQPQYSINAANSPIKARVGSVYESGWSETVKYLYIQSKTNDLIIGDIELNRGNCRNVSVIPAYSPQFPFTLQFGDTARVILNMGGSVLCDLLEARIKTNKGIFVFDKI
jgi:hypothetical protein